MGGAGRRTRLRFAREQKQDCAGRGEQGDDFSYFFITELPTGPLESLYIAETITDRSTRRARER